MLPDHGDLAGVYQLSEEQDECSSNLFLRHVELPTKLQGVLSSLDAFLGLRFLRSLISLALASQDRGWVLVLTSFQHSLLQTWSKTGH